MYAPETQRLRSLENRQKLSGCEISGLEVRFTWNAVTQFRPVPLATVREIWKARPMNIALEKLVMKNRRIRFDEVRTEGKLLASLLRGWAMIAP